MLFVKSFQILDYAGPDGFVFNACDSFGLFLTNYIALQNIINM
jgi:hypothetical protein